jgi:hypothetical protein
MPMTEEPAEPESEKVGPARSDQLVDEAGRESFPASDPPATWSGVDHRDMETESDGETPAGPATGSG